MQRIVGISFTLIFVSTLALPAYSQEPARSAPPSGDQFYVFEDDPLDAVGLSERGARLRLRRDAGRVTLIRPRAHFVRELTRSVEDL